MKAYGIIIMVCLFAVSAFAQSEGGYINKTGDGTTSAWSDNQALNAITQPFTMKMADSTASTITTKYGTHYRLCRIANVSSTDQRIKVVTFNGDTSTVLVTAGTCSERLPFIRRVISGAVVDSTRYDFLYR